MFFCKNVPFFYMGFFKDKNWTRLKKNPAWCHRDKNSEQNEKKYQSDCHDGNRIDGFLSNLSTRFNNVFLR